MHFHERTHEREAEASAAAIAGLKLSNARACCSKAMPLPVSVTVRRTTPSRRSAATVMVSPRSVWRSALENKFTITWVMRFCVGVDLADFRIAFHADRHFGVARFGGGHLHAFGERGVDIHRREIELDVAGFDHGDVEGCCRSVWREPAASMIDPT